MNTGIFQTGNPTGRSFDNTAISQGQRSINTDVEQGIEARDSRSFHSHSNSLDTSSTSSDTSSTVVSEEQYTWPTPPKYNGGVAVGYSTARQIALVLSLAGVNFLNTMAYQAVVICLPEIGRDLHIPASREQWIINAYSITFGCFLLLFGRIADVYGNRLVYLFGSVWLCVITISIPFAKTEAEFDLLRGLQGMGAAANVPTAIGILASVFPPGKRKDYAFAMLAGGAPLGSVMGNILAGVLIHFSNWHWVFWVMSIFAGIITLSSWLVILPTPPSLPITHQTRREAAASTAAAAAAAKRTIDWCGGFLITAGVLILLFALAEVNVVGWSTPWIPVLMVLSILLILAFIYWQYYQETRTSKMTLMKPSMFRSARFSGAVATMFFFFIAFNSYLYFATFYYQLYLDLEPIQTTLRFIPTGIAGLIVIALVSQILSRVRGNHILMFASTCMALASLLLALPIPPSTSYFAYGLPAMCLCVLGADTLFPTIMLFVSRSLPPEDQALGGGLVNALGQIGRAVGLAIATAIELAVVARERGVAVELAGVGLKAGDPALLAGLRAAQYFCAACAVVALAVGGIAFRGAGIVGGGRREIDSSKDSGKDSEMDSSKDSEKDSESG